MATGNQATTFYVVRADIYNELTIKPTRTEPRALARFAPLGVSSKETIRSAIAAARKSPFDTVFVVSPETWKPVFAISSNEEFVLATKKKKGGGGGGPTLPPGPVEECCNECIARGASGCLVLENLDCWCLYDDNDQLDQELEVLIP